MNLKKGDKIKLKSHVTHAMLNSIGIRHTPEQLKNGKFRYFHTSNSGYSFNLHQTGRDVATTFSTPTCGAIPYTMPEVWIERERSGHHLTNIFK
jgi:hypothetical protein